MKNASMKNAFMKKELSSTLLRYSPFSTLVGFLVFSNGVFAGELAELPYEAGNWTPPKVYILFDNSESMRSETVVPPGNEALFPFPGVREGIVAQWDELYFRRFADPNGARVKFITGVALPGVLTVNTSGTSVLSPNTQCNIIDPTKNTLYFDSDPARKNVGYMPWIWWGDSGRYPGFSDASLSDIPSWFRYGSCSGINTLSDLPPVKVLPVYKVETASNGSWASDYAAWSTGSLSQKDAANWWKYHSTRSKLVQGALSDAMDYLKGELIFGIRELNGPKSAADMQLNLGTDLAPDNTVSSAVNGVDSPPVWVIPPSESAVTISGASTGLGFDVNIPAQNYHTPGVGPNEVFDQAKIEARNVAIINSLLKREDLGNKTDSGGITRLRPKNSIGRTPLRTGLHSIGRYFEGGGTDNICQRTFALVVTDGYWNESYGGANPSDPITGDQDGDSHSVTVADIAAYFYKTGFGANGLVANDWNNKTQQHLSTYVVSMGLQGNLSTPSSGGCNGDWPSSVGAVNPLPLPPTVTGMAANWGDPQTSKTGLKHVGVADAERVDDLWHAAYNSRGHFVNTNDAYTLAQRIFYSFKSMHEQSQSFEDRDIVSGIELNLESTPKKLYVASFNPSNWSGSIKAYNLTANGDIDSVAFNNVSGFADSGGTKGNVFTFNTTIAAPVEFNYNSLGEKEKTDLVITETIRLSDQVNPSCAKPAVDADALVNYLKGDTTNEGENSLYKFRDRTSVIGDIVHSKPVFVGNPSKYYKDKWANQNARENKDIYSNFVSTVGARLPMLYVGANDGYLHGFRADDGYRHFSYMPSFLLKDIGLLADTNYTHQYFMDGQIAVDDVCLAKPGDGCDWMTLLVGSGGSGGQGLFALDVTTPGLINASKVLWEFTDLNNNSGAATPHEADLGYVMGTPNIGRFRKAGSAGSARDAGQWLVVFGGGYHNTEDNLQKRGYRNPFSIGGTDPATTKSTTGQAYLYMLDARNGKIVKKIGVPGGSVTNPNGVGSPALIDADSDDIIDYVYFGDLLGRLWKIDVRNDNPDKWFSLTTTLSSQITILTTNDALFNAPATGSGQPITVAPLVVFHPNHLFDPKRDPLTGEIVKGTTLVPDRHKLMVYFGTGKFFEKGDSIPKNQTAAQAFYAIYDDGTNQELKITNLQKRTKDGSYSVKTPPSVVNGSTAFVAGGANSSAGQHGWYLSLHPTNGERIVVDADYRAAKDKSGSTVLSESKVFFNIMVPSAGGNCQVVAASTVNGFAMILDPLTGNNAYYAPSATVATGGFRLSRSAGFSNIRTQGFNGGSDRLYLEAQSADGTTNTMSSVSVGSSDRYHRESFLQLTQ